MLREKLRELASHEPLTPTSICVVVEEWLTSEETQEGLAQRLEPALHRDGPWSEQQAVLREVERHLITLAQSLKGTQ